MSAVQRRMIALVAVVMAAALTLLVRRSGRRPTPPPSAPLPAAVVQAPADVGAAVSEPDASGHFPIDVELWKLPGALPGLGPVAPPLQAADLLPQISGVVRRGQITQSDALHAARAVWPALARCGIDRRRAVTATFSLSGGQTVGSSAVHGPKLAGALSPTERDCALAGLVQVQAPVATDCQGEVEVHFGNAAAPAP